MTEMRKEWLKRVLIGGAAGLGECLIFSWLLYSGPGHFAGFAFYIGHREPKLPWEVLGILLWVLFGAEIGMATLPFDDRGWMLAVKSLAHFAAMEVTVGAWVWINITWHNLPYVMIPLAAVYLVVWLVRWAFWYFELRAIREKLGLKTGKEREG